MTKELCAFFISLFAGLSTMIGSFLIFLKPNKNNIDKSLVFFLAFAIAVMIGISLFDLIPAGLPGIINKFKGYAIPIVGILFLIAYLIIKKFNHLLDNNQNNLYKLGILSMLVMIIHNIPEGIITYISSISNYKLGIKIAMAIALHNIPEGIIISMPIYYATGKKGRAVGLSFLSGISEPIGALLTYLILKNFISDLLIGLILIIVAGLMIVLAIENIYPETTKYNNKKYLYIGFISGLAIILLSLLL